MNVYDIVTKRILEELKKGEIPWARSWKPEYHLPMNWLTGRPYQGINFILTQWNGQYATYKQIKEAGGNVKKGAKATPIVFWKPLEKSDDEIEERKKRFCIQYYSVFEVEVDTEGIRRKEVEPVQPISKQELLKEYLESGPTIVHGYSGASYEPTRDTIRMPSTGRFESHSHYYMTLFHEAIHSTGHESRLSRVLVGRGEDIKAYAQEELIAEIGSAFLCNLSGIDSEEMLKRNTSYLQSWLSLLEDHPRMILIASSAAQKAVDLITNISSRGNLKAVA